MLLTSRKALDKLLTYVLSYAQSEGFFILHIIPSCALYAQPCSGSGGYSRA